MAELKPTTEPRFAEDSLNETIENNGQATIVSNKEVLTEEYISTGVQALEPPARPYVNTILNELCKWVRHLNGRDTIGLIVSYNTTAGKTATLVQNERGGTWVSRGTYNYDSGDTADGGDTVSSITVELFEKTA